MRRTILATAAAVGLLATMTGAAVAAPPADAPAYGLRIQACLGDNYGQAKNAAWASGHAAKPALGAKLTYLAHCVVD